MASRAIAVALLTAGAVLVLIAAGVIQTPGGGGGGTTTTSQTTTAIVDGRLVAEAVDAEGRRLAARIYVDGREVSADGYASITVESGEHAVDWGDVQGYNKPPRVSVLVSVGSTSTVRGVYHPASTQTFTLTVWVRVCSITLNVCYDDQGASVKVDGLHIAQTDRSGRAYFNVAAGSHHVEVFDPAFGTQSRTVAVSGNTEVEFRYYTGGLSILPGLTTDLMAAALFAAMAVAAYLVVRRRG